MYFFYFILKNKVHFSFINFFSDNRNQIRNRRDNRNRKNRNCCITTQNF
jgi:hypothetical protein